MITSSSNLPFVKTAFITGSAKRLGLQMAKHLAQEHWVLVLHTHSSSSEAEAACAELKSLGAADVHLVTSDLRDETQMSATYERAIKAAGPLGVLINNASAFDYDDIKSATEDSWNLHMLINARAPFVLSQRLAADVTSNQRACIINMLDQRIFNWNPHFTTYSIAKGALWTMTQTLAIALAPRIRVNGIGPGPTLPSAQQDWDSFKIQKRYTLLDRLVDPQEVAETMHFLIHNQSVTGQMIAVDGGQHLNWAPPKSRDMDITE